MTLTLRYAAQSDRGLIRDLNQDSVYAGPRLLAVADGMGGMAAGDVASNIVIAAMAPLDEDVPGDALVDALRHAVGQANQHLRDTVDANPQLEGMGTTLTAVLFSGSKFGMVHIGDSRAYLLRKGEFAQITKDDTYVQMLVDEGRVSPEEASSHPQRSLLTRALDGRDIDPEYSVRQVLAGDRYLICSDGLSGVVSADTIDADDARDHRPAGLRRAAGPAGAARRRAGQHHRGDRRRDRRGHRRAVADRGRRGRHRPGQHHGGRQLHAGGPGLGAAGPARAAAAAGAGRRVRPGAGAQGPPGAHHAAPAGAARRCSAAACGWATATPRTSTTSGATEAGQLAIFRGVPGQIAGLDLSSVNESSPARLDDLTAVAQERVKQGIHADNRPDAVRRLAELTDDNPSNPNLKPLCNTAGTTPSGTPSATSTAPAASATATAPTALASSPSAQISESAPPVVDPVGCRTVN